MSEYIAANGQEAAEGPAAGKKRGYPAVFAHEDGCGVSVEFPDLGVATCGENDADALASARELLGCVLRGMDEDGEAIPEPSPISSFEGRHVALVSIGLATEA